MYWRWCAPLRGSFRIGVMRFFGLGDSCRVNKCMLITRRDEIKIESTDWRLGESTVTVVGASKRVLWLMLYREATALDADAIAVLHAESWRRAYRGHLSDAYLDGPIFKDRTSVWRGRFQPVPTPGMSVTPPLLPLPLFQSSYSPVYHVYRCIA
jgi:hypothetical protein